MRSDFSINANAKFLDRVMRVKMMYNGYLKKV